VLANTGSDTVPSAQISKSVADDKVVSQSISSKLSGNDAFSVSVDGNNFVITASGDSCPVLTDTVMGQLSEGDSLSVSVQDDVCTITITSETFAFSEEGTKGLRLEGEDQTELAGATEEELDETVAQEAIESLTEELVTEQQKPSAAPDAQQELAKAHETVEEQEELSKLDSAVKDAEHKKPDSFDYASNKLRYSRTHSKSFPLPQMESEELRGQSLGGFGNDEESDGTQTARDSLPGAEADLLAFWDRQTLENVNLLERSLGRATLEQDAPRILPAFYNDEFYCTSSAGGTGCFTPPVSYATVKVCSESNGCVTWDIEGTYGPKNVR